MLIYVLNSLYVYYSHINLGDAACNLLSRQLTVTTAERVDLKRETVTNKVIIHIILLLQSYFVAFKTRSLMPCSIYSCFGKL